MSSNTTVIFIGIPDSNPTLDKVLLTFISNTNPPLDIEPITVFDGKTVPQWNFTKSYFIHVNPNDARFNQLVSEFGGNDISDLDSIMIGFNTKAYYLDLFEALLELQ